MKHLAPMCCGLFGALPKMWGLGHRKAIHSDRHLQLVQTSATRPRLARWEVTGRHKARYGAHMNNLTATDVAQTLSPQRRDSSRRFERLPPEGREERRYACFVWQAILPAGGLSGRRAGWKARLQPGLAATQQRCGPTQFPRPPNLPGRLQEFGVSARQARVPHRHLLTR